MNETIGVKGGKRDQIRRMIITRNQKKKLEDYQKELDKYELEKLEKKVKQLQRATLIKVAPLAITGSIIKSIVPHQEKKEVQIEKAHEEIRRGNWACSYHRHHGAGIQAAHPAVASYWL